LDWWMSGHQAVQGQGQRKRLPLLTVVKYHSRVEA
jgi:hypothetical protein